LWDSNVPYRARLIETLQLPCPLLRIYLHLDRQTVHDWQQLDGSVFPLCLGYCN
jgi:hypothetical protein